MPTMITRKLQKYLDIFLYDLSGYKTRVILQERFDQFENTPNYQILYDFIATKGETSSNWDAVRSHMDTINTVVIGAIMV